MNDRYYQMIGTFYQVNNISDTIIVLQRIKKKKKKKKKKNTKNTVSIFFSNIFGISECNAK